MKSKHVVSAAAMLLAMSTFIVACGGNDAVQVSSGTVITNATIVGTEDGSLAAGKSIVIDKGKIQSITDGPVQAVGSAQTVDGTGMFVVPGFMDMHAHAMVAVDQQPSYWPLMIANGITGIREMGGSAALIQRARQLNAARAAGTVDAPEVLAIPSDIFQGQAITPAQGIQFVDQKLAEGADFIKLVGGGAPVVNAILAEAKTKGAYVAGHLVPSLSALDSSNAGWHTIEHLGSGWGLMLDCAADQADIRQAVLSGGAASPPFPPTFVVNPRVYDGAQNAQFYQRIYDTYTASQCQSLAQAFAKNDTWQVPTLIRLRTQSFGNDPLYRNDPNLIYVDKTRRALWNQLGDQFSSSMPAAAAGTLQQFYGLELRVTKLLSDSGVKMMTGSDIGGVWVIPGFSLHQEFKELAAAGLSPLTILQMATLNGAKFLHREGDLGTVEAGKSANLVLLAANPLANVANLDQIAGVFLGGKYFAKSELDKMKSDVAAAYELQTVQDVRTALDPADID